MTSNLRPATSPTTSGFSSSAIRLRWPTGGFDAARTEHRNMSASHRWNETSITSEDQALQVLTELRGKRWLSRGLSKSYGGLVPSIDRGRRDKMSRREKLGIERQSIDIFQSTARFFATRAEELALRDDFIALCVLRHYGVPTRLLDWSMSPYVAAYFAACDHDAEDGEIWSFNEPFYEEVGKEQWKTWPET